MSSSWGCAMRSKQVYHDEGLSARRYPDANSSLAPGVLSRAVACARPWPPPVEGGKTIDAHGHLTHHSRPDWRATDRQVIDVYDKLGIDQGCCSILSTHPATPEAFRECDQWVYEAMQRFPGRILGYAHVNPGYGAEAIEEVRRCVEDRDSWVSSCIDDYVVSGACSVASDRTRHPVARSHPAPRRPRQLAAVATTANQRRSRFAEIGKRYPEAMIICGHICGGGDWEWRDQVAAQLHPPFTLIRVGASLMKVLSKWPPHPGLRPAAVCV